ncbi:MAG: tail fiber protein [Bacteroidota bacterium]
MEFNKRDRTELKEYFRATKKPTEKQFAEFIDATINQADDGIAKLPGTPLSVSAEGDSIGTQEVMHFYQDFGQEIPGWSFNLNPRTNTDDPNSNQNGFNIKDATGKSSLFIKSGQGNVGIGTIEPSAPLTVQGNAASGLPEQPIKIAADSIEFGGQDNSQNADSAKLAVDNESFKLYGKADNTGENRRLDVLAEGGLQVSGSVNIQGNIQAENVATNKDLGGEEASDENLPSQKAVKEYIDTRLPKGMITMWSGSVAPEGWALCNGENGTPNLSGQFIVGYDESNTDYDEIGMKGGENKVSLKEAELPSHTHQDTGHTHEISDPGHNHTGKLNKDMYRGSKFDSDMGYAKNLNFNGLVRLTNRNTGGGVDSNPGVGYEFDLRAYGEIQPSQSNIKIKTGKSNLTATGGDQPHENRPPYFVLAYIMKL